MKSSQAPAAGLEISVAAAAAAVGLTASTLRTWDHRYGMSPSIRTAGGHRRYNDEDLVRLRAAARLIDDGVPPAGAAQTVRGWTFDQCEALLKPTPAQLATSIARSQDSSPDHPVSGVKRVLSMSNPTDEQRRLARAAMDLDGRSVRNIMAQEMSTKGAVRAWEGLAAPVLVALGKVWSRTASGIEIEHVASQGIAEALNVECAVDENRRPVLLCCAPNDQHALPLLALRAALGENGVEATMLGQQVPIPALTAAINRLRPRAVVVWATLPHHADPDVLASIPRHRPPIRTFVAGPGWGSAELDGSGAKQLLSLSAAVTELVG